MSLPTGVSLRELLGNGREGWENYTVGIKYVTAHGILSGSLCPWVQGAGGGQRCGISWTWSYKWLGGTGESNSDPLQEQPVSSLVSHLSRPTCVFLERPMHDHQLFLHHSDFVTLGLASWLVLLFPMTDMMIDGTLGSPWCPQRQLFKYWLPPQKMTLLQGTTAMEAVMETRLWSLRLLVA